MEKLKSFHIETISSGSFNFFTTAKNHKTALRRLLKHSSDFRNIVSDKKDMTIIIKQL
jgi:hypothetical protein